ncbi:MAG: heavy-metal-associated domain-containing protein [Thermosipho sp. (in: Bacteria)]|nr:heavy-metal-associated domain-containing protein [Thermosipho sp. (in: thermotogales)]
MGKFILHVPDMSCKHCVMRIKNALEETGEKNFEIKLDEKIIIIETNNLETVKSKLSEIDYPVKEAKSI